MEESSVLGITSNKDDEFNLSIQGQFADESLTFTLLGIPKWKILGWEFKAQEHSIYASGKQVLDMEHFPNNGSTRLKIFDAYGRSLVHFISHSDLIKQVKKASPQ